MVEEGEELGRRGRCLLLYVNIHIGRYADRKAIEIRKLRSIHTNCSKYEFRYGRYETHGI